MKAVWRSALLLAGLVAAGLALRSGIGTSALAAPAQAGPLAFVLAGAVACAVGIPRQVVAYAAGLGFGTWGGLLLALLAEMLGCAADFLWARLVARDWATRRLGTRLAWLDQRLAQHPFSATLTIRLLPVGSNLLTNLAAGISAVPAGPFLLASALGFVPQTIVFTLLGDGVQVDGTAKLYLGAALFVAATLLGLLLMRRMRTALL